jgi:RNA polymerase sigma-70 factor, ECF subfamily
MIHEASPWRDFLDESALTQRAIRGDMTAWQPLMLAHQEAVFRLAYLLLGDPDDAADVAQETFVRAWGSLGRFDASRPLRPWLLRIAANLAHNHRRSAGRQLAALVRTFQAGTTPSTVEDKSIEHMESRQLWQALRRLRPTDQQILYLRYFLDLSVAETAEAMQVAQGTVKSRLNRALGRLRAVIQREYPAFQDSTDS